MEFEQIQAALVVRIHEAGKVLKLDDSHSALRQKLQQQVAVDHRKDNAETSSDYYDYPYIEDVYGDGASGTVITSRRGEHVMANYKGGADGFKISGHAKVAKAYVKESQEVVVNGEPLAAKESLIEDMQEELLDLREAAFDANDEGVIKFIAPGHGSTGYYSPELLKESTEKGVFDNAQMFIDHATDQEERDRPEGTVHGLAAKGGKAWYDESGPAGPGVYTKAKVYPDTKDFLNQRAKDIGVSIRALGRGVAGQVGGRVNKIVKELSVLKSADFVTRAGAGGKLLALLESYRTQKQGMPALKEKEMEIDEKELARLKESAALVPELKLRLDRADERNARIDARDLARTTLKESKLPVRAQDRVLGMVSDSNYALPLKEGGLDHAAFKTALNKMVEEEANYLKESGVPTGSNLGDGGRPSFIEPTEDDKKFKESQKKIKDEFDEGIKALAGVRKAS